MLASAYAEAKKLNGGVFKFESLVDMSAGIDSHGKSQYSLLLPNLSHIGTNAGLGLPFLYTNPKLTSIQYDSEGKGYWLRITSTDQNQVERTAFTLLSEEKCGRDAVLMKLCPANKSLYDGYRTARSSPFQIVCFLPQVNAEEVIQNDGTPQHSLLLPNFMSISGCAGLGLPSQCRSPVLVSVQYDPTRKGYWLELRGTDSNNQFKHSLVLLSDDPTKKGKDSVLEVASPAAKRTIVEIYNQRNTPSRAIDISELIGSQNRVRYRWPLPGGESLRNAKDISLRKNDPIKSLNISQSQSLQGNRFIFFATAKYENGSTQHVRLLISNSGIEVIGSTEKESAQICKGFALDRFIAHVAAVGALPDAVANPVHVGSTLTGEVHIPNIQALSTIIHSKWGKDPGEVFSYILRYGRMMRLNDLPAGCFLIADDTHHEALRDALTEASQELQFNAGITTVHQWAERVASKDLKVTEELNVLQALADAGLEEDLKNRTYSPTIPTAEQVTPKQDDWKARVKGFADPDAAEALLQTLEKDLSVHSLFWEEQYHLTLAKHLSFLLEETEHHPQRTAIETLVYQFYPELEQYPGAWRALDSDAAAQMPKRQSLTLSKFDLAETLAVLKAPKRQAAQPDEPAIGAGKVIEIPELREFCHRGNAVTKDSITAFISEAEELKTKYPENTSLLGDTCLAAFCKIAGLAQRLWQASQTLADIKSGAISPSQDIIPALSSELKSFRLTVAQLARISKIYS